MTCFDPSAAFLFDCAHCSAFTSPLFSFWVTWLTPQAILMEAKKKKNSSWSYAGLLPEWAVVEDGRPIREFYHSPSLLVWAKVTGHPWWPALLKAPTERGKCRRPEKQTNIWIYNLGANNFSEANATPTCDAHSLTKSRVWRWLQVDPATQILPYSYHNTQKFGTPLKIKPAYRKDMKKATLPRNQPPLALTRLRASFKAMDEAAEILAQDKRGLCLGERPAADAATVAPPPPGVIDDDAAVNESYLEEKEDKEIAAAEEEDGEYVFGEEE